MGKEYFYFYHMYNYTWRCERSVEIPIVWDFVSKSNGSVLEVGNVLSHYFPVSHEIVDKYEKGHGVINKDIIDFKPNKKYDLIVSISTIEHIGDDEEPRNPDKILKVLGHLKSLSSNKGKIVLTFPLNYNKDLDKFIKKGEIKFDELYFLKRSSRNEWVETDMKDAFTKKYGKEFYGANAVGIGILKNGYNN
ncbi:MAG: hypothetical protein QXY45_00710 [Candidatus Aenigmatarchaeota archaeon]